MATTAEAIHLGDEGLPGNVGRNALSLVSTDPEFDISLVGAFEAQQTAFADMPGYEVEVIDRSPFGAPEETDAGKFHQEKVRFSDGAVRLVTVGEPQTLESPYPIVSGDPWYTGSDGFNKWSIQQQVGAGFAVIWPHHQGRHSLKPNSRDHIKTAARFLLTKSVGKSAAQDHALLDHMAPTLDFDVSRVIRKGYSRSAMSGEAFIAQTALPEVKREVVWSDLEAACFAKKVGHIGFLTVLFGQLPDELKTLAKVLSEAVDHGEDGLSPDLSDMAKTVDLHPLNMTHEAAWLRLLISGDTGVYARAIPLDARGVRTVYTRDRASQHAEQERIHAFRGNIAVIERPGTHLSGATRQELHVKRERDARLLHYMQEHDNDLSEIRPADILDYA